MYIYQLVLTLQAKPSLIKTTPFSLHSSGSVRRRGGGGNQTGQNRLPNLLPPRAQSKIYTIMTLLLLEFLKL